MILLAYDGSPDADAAIDHVAALMPAAGATVLTVWEPFAMTVARTASLGFAGLSGSDSEVDDVTRRDAVATAARGALRATRAGLVAHPRETAVLGGTAEAILAVADEVDASMIVLGTRGRGGVTSFLLGSVSHAVLQHADRPVLVVPSAHVAERRRGWTHSSAEPAVA